MNTDDRALAGLIAELRGLLAKATPVPWGAQGTQTEGEDRGVGIIGLRLDEAGESMFTPTNGIVAAALPCPTEIDDNDYTRVEANAALLVGAVNALPTLLDRLEAFHVKPVVGDVEAVTKAILFSDSGSTEGWEDNVSLGQAAIEAMPQEGRAVAALRSMLDVAPIPGEGTEK